jgi:hypothetical protein
MQLPKKIGKMKRWLRHKILCNHCGVRYNGLVPFPKTSREHFDQSVNTWVNYVSYFGEPMYSTFWSTQLKSATDWSWTPLEASIFKGKVAK